MYLAGGIGEAASKAARAASLGLINLHEMHACRTLADKGWRCACHTQLMLTQQAWEPPAAAAGLMVWFGVRCLLIASEACSASLLAGSAQSSFWILVFLAR